MGYRSSLTQGASLLVMGMGLVVAAAQPVAACPTTILGPTTILATTSCVAWSGSGNFIINSGVILGAATPALSVNVTSGTITNNGTIHGGQYGVDNASSSTLTRLTNASGATITADISAAIRNQGTIGTVSNSGKITIANGYGIENHGSIGSIDNSGQIISNSFGIYNVANSTIGTITNNSGGTISGGISGSGANRKGIDNRGTIVAITNSSNATIIGGVTGIVNFTNTSGIGALTNNGTITGGTIGVANGGNIDTLTNAGVISSASYGFANGQISSPGGSITALNNNGGTITGGAYAIYQTSYGSIGAVTNSGVIAGNVSNLSTNDLTINGGSGSTYGLLTGYNAGSASTSSVGTVGSISNTSSNLVFSSGNIWLNDDINVTGHRVSVTGANVKVSNTVTITGIYSQTGGRLNVANGAQISISGSSAATVTDTDITISGSSLRAGTYTIVNANAVGTYLTGDTVTVSGTSGLTATLGTADGGNDLIATLTASNSGGSGGSDTYTGKGQAAGGAAVGMGSALDAIVASNSPQAVAFQNNVLSVLSGLSPNAQKTAIKQLAPTQITPASQAASQAAAPTASVIEQHELALLDGGAVGAAAGSPGHDFGLWGQILGGGALRGSNSTADGYRSRNFGLVSGLDYELDADTTVGAAVSWVRGWSWGSGDSAGSDVSTNSYQITGYGLHRWGAAFVDGQLGFGYNTFDQTRTVGFLGQKANASYNGQQYLAKIGVGYDLPVSDDVTLTPLAGLRFLRAVSDSYNESGSSANLSIDRRGVQSLTQDLGGKVSWKQDTDWGRLTPEVRLAWVHDYTQGPIASSGFIGGQSFSTPVGRTSPDGAKINLAVTLDTQGDVSFRAEYEGEARPDYQSHSGLVKATWGF